MSGIGRTALVGVALALGSVALWSSVSVANESTRASLGDALKVHARAQQPGDKPTFAEFNAAEHGMGGLRGETTRLVGKEGVNSFFSTQDAVGNICLLVVNERDGLTSSTCGPIDAVRAAGLPLKMTYLDDTTEVFLVPDGVTVTCRVPGIESVRTSWSSGTKRWSI